MSLVPVKLIALLGHFDTLVDLVYPLGELINFFGYFDPKVLNKLLFIIGPILCPDFH